jgi:hypothetical protein
MGKTTQNAGPPWPDLSRRQWELLWQGEMVWKKHATRIWEVGHKTVTLFQGALKTPLPTTLCMAGDGTQTHHARVPRVKGMPESARKIIQSYLDMTGGPQGSTKDWSTSPRFAQWQGHQTTKVIPSLESRDLVKSLIYEPPGPMLVDGLEEVTGLLKEGTTVS